MNGNGYEMYDDVLESLEEVGDYEFDDELTAFLEDDEAKRARRGGRRPVPAGKGANYYKQRPTDRYVTQAQLQSALGKISKDVKANAAGVKTVGARVDTVNAEQKKQSDVLKKEIVARKKDLSKLKSGIQMASILPLVTSKSIVTTSEATIGGVTVPAGTKLAVAPDTLSALLPMFLLGDGLGGGGGESGDSSNMLFLALAVGGGL